MALKTYNKTADEIENEGGGVQTPGWYKAIVEDAGPAPKKPLEDMRFVFQVTEGAYTGAKVMQFIANPEFGADEEASKKLNARLLSFASRLGVWDGVSPDPDPQWDECIGNDVVIHVELNQYTDKTTKQLVTKHSLAYIGVYPPDHPKIPAEVRKALDLPPARKVEAAKPGAKAPARSAPPAKRREDISDL